MMDLFSYTTRIQSEYYRETTPEYRKQKGQVFTPPEIARFMARLLSDIPQTFHLLDPGAGLGSLTVAVCEQVIRQRTPRNIHVVLFESDSRLADLLHNTLDYCRRELINRGHVFEYTIREEDFIIAAASRLDGQGRLFDTSLETNYDAIIMNPPYFKVRANSEHAKILERIVHGQPNAYAFFMAMAASLLTPNGQLIAITPRSFCNGLYFRGFREWFFERMCLDHIHLFESRVDAFRDSNVLQESIITKSHRLGRPTTSVAITESYGKQVPQQPNGITLAHDEVLDSTRGEHIVKIPVSDDDCNIMRSIESLPNRFSEVGLRVSTGPVVTFRAKDLLLREVDGEPAVPLIMPHNIRRFQIEWPVQRKAHPVYIIDCRESRERKLLVPTKNYVLLKRFTSKEENRRLTAACLIKREQQTEYIGLENHVNYVYHADRELATDETFGIAAVFNSLLLDRYFRILSGNTQVNATEVRNLHFPSLDILAMIGKRTRSLGNRLPADTEAIVLDVLGIKKSFHESLMVVA